MKIVLTLLLFAPATLAFTPQPPKSTTKPLRSFTYGNVASGGESVQEKTPANVPAPPLAEKASKIAAGGRVETAPRPSNVQNVKNIWETTAPIIVQGGSLRTWSFATPAIERIQIAMKTEGRPLNANLELWHGPDNTPQKMGIYVEDGCLRPFSAIIETPRGHNAIAIRNTGHLEFPLTACVEADIKGRTAPESSLGAITQELRKISSPKLVQGGAVRTFPFDPEVASVQIMLKTDGRPLNAKIELLQGPNNNKQVMEIYTEDGNERPFFAVVETPGTGNVVRIANTATVEFPLSCSVEPYLIETTSFDFDQSDFRGWDSGGGTNSIFMDGPQW